MANSVGNMSPLLNNTNPLSDLRLRFDDMYHIRSAEWQGMYPSDMHATPNVVSDEQRQMIKDLFPRE